MKQNRTIQYQPLWVDKKLHDIIKKHAKKNNRTIIGELKAKYPRLPKEEKVETTQDN